MHSPITYFDIARYQKHSRNVVLSEGKRYSSLKYDHAKKGNIYDIKNFFFECASSPDIAVDYASACLELLEQNQKDTELVTIWKESILPIVDTYTVENLSEVTTVKEFKDILKDEMVIRKISERTLSNHEQISERVNLEEFISERNMNFDRFYLETARVINGFNMPAYAKFNCAIEEASYLLQKHAIKYDCKNMLCRFSTFFKLSEQTTEKSRAQFEKVANENYFVIKDEDRAYMTTRSMVKSACMRFEDQYEYDNTPIAFGGLIASMISAPIGDLGNNFDSFLDLIISMIVSREDKKDDVIIEYILSEGLTLATNRIIKSVQDKNAEDDVAELYEKLIKHINDRISKNGPLGGKYTYVYRYTSKLIDMKDTFNTMRQLSYPAYNIRSMTENTLVETESPKLISIDEFRIFKFDNLITRLWKADKYLQTKFNQFKNKMKFKWKYRKIRSKIFKESVAEEFIGADGDIDFSIATIDYEPNSYVNEIHEELVTICKFLNEDAFANSEYRCYYLVNPTSIDIRVRCIDGTLVEAADNITLTEDELSTIANMMLVAEYVDEEYNLIDAATSYFCENPNPEVFDLFVDACEVAGVNKESVEDVFESIKINIPLQESIGIISLKYYRIENYTILENVDPMDRITGYLVLQALTEDFNSKNKFNISKNNKGTDKNKNVDKNKKPEEKKKNEIKNPFKGVNINNMKLAINGIRGKIKDADVKVKTAVRNMDYAVERLGQDLKKAMVSDRREAIIKGSVIPSFHKCIMIAVGEAALWMVNPVFAIVAAIGGLATSKKLTKKERALLLDDIEVELRIVEKELQNAESRNQIKKMRSLMKIQKDLERTYQRIRFNMAAGKDLIPSSTGTPSFRD